MKKPVPWLVAFVVTLFLFIASYKRLRGGPRSVDATARITETLEKPDSSHGIASFYEVATNGIRTASGIPLNDSVSTAAHRTLPFGTIVRVINLNNGSRATVKITDRGPYRKGRIIDVSRNAAEKLEMIKAGVASVKIEVLFRGPLVTKTSLVGD